MKGKTASVFGSYGWSGEAIRTVQDILTSMRIKVSPEPIKGRMTPNEQRLVGVLLDLVLPLERLAADERLAHVADPALEGAFLRADHATVLVHGTLRSSYGEGTPAARSSYRGDLRASYGEGTPAARSSYRGALRIGGFPPPHVNYPTGEPDLIFSPENLRRSSVIPRRIAKKGGDGGTWETTRTVAGKTPPGARARHHRGGEGEDHLVPRDGGARRRIRDEGPHGPVHPVFAPLRRARRGEAAGARVRGPSGGGGGRGGPRALAAVFG